MRNTLSSLFTPAQPRGEPGIELGFHAQGVGCLGCHFASAPSCGRKAASNQTALRRGYILPAAVGFTQGRKTHNDRDWWRLARRRPTEPGTDLLRRHRVKRVEARPQAGLRALQGAEEGHLAASARAVGPSVPSTWGFEGRDPRRLQPLDGEPAAGVTIVFSPGS